VSNPLDGVRVLEVAQFTFVPSAGAVLADWGADVVKIEHPVTGDAQRGLVKVLGRAASLPGSSFAPFATGVPIAAAGRAAVERRYLTEIYLSQVN